MRLPNFLHIREHTAIADNWVWELEVEGTPISGYCDANGLARDIMIHFRGFSALANNELNPSFPNGIVIV